MKYNSKKESMKFEKKEMAKDMSYKKKQYKDDIMSLDKLMSKVKKI